MANQEHLDILKQGVEAWNKWRDEELVIKPDLSGADLSRMHLMGFDFTGVNLKGSILVDTDFFGAKLGVALKMRKSTMYFSSVNLVEADLTRANLGHVDLHRANLAGANLTDADLESAVLHKTNLNKADLTHTFLYYTNFNQAELDETNFTNARMGGTIFGEVDLSKARGLETVSHDAPLIIGIDTIYRSQGNIPEVFLRRAGVPNSFIEYMRSLAGKPIDFYSCFISYSRKDQEFADRLYTDLQSKGVRCWYAPEDLKIGEEFPNRIEEAIRFYDKLLVILSENSVKSSWVEDEVRAALEKEEQPKTVLFPIKIDNAIEQEQSQWVAMMRRKRHIGDFTCWKEHDEYQKAFDRLLRDLKAE